MLTEANQEETVAALTLTRKIEKMIGRPIGGESDETGEEKSSTCMIPGCGEELPVDSEENRQTIERNHLRKKHSDIFPYL